MSFTFQAIGVNELKKAMSKFGAELPVALASGLNRTVRAIEQTELNEIERSIDRPTPFTMNAVRTWNAHPRHIDAGLFVLPLQAKYLKYAIEGGSVPSTILPFAIRTDASGNIPGKRRGWSGIARGKNVFVAKIKKGRASRKTGLWKRQGDSAFLLALRSRGERRKKRWPYYETAEKAASKRLSSDLMAAIDGAVR